MGIRIEKHTIVQKHYRHVFPGREEVEEYMKKHPFPETEHYSAEDLLEDTQSSGAWWLPDEITEEQKEYIIEMISFFL